MNIRKTEKQDRGMMETKREGGKIRFASFKILCFEKSLISTMIS